MFKLCGFLTRHHYLPSASAVLQSFASRTINRFLCSRGTRSNLKQQQNFMQIKQRNASVLPLFSSSHKEQETHPHHLGFCQTLAQTVLIRHLLDCIERADIIENSLQYSDFYFGQRNCLILAELLSKRAKLVKKSATN